MCKQAVLKPKFLYLRGQDGEKWAGLWFWRRGQQDVDQYEGCKKEKTPEVWCTPLSER